MVDWLIWDEVVLVMIGFRVMVELFMEDMVVGFKA